MVVDDQYVHAGKGLLVVAWAVDDNRVGRVRQRRGDGEPEAAALAEWLRGLVRRWRDFG